MGGTRFGAGVINGKGCNFPSEHSFWNLLIRSRIYLPGHYGTLHVCIHNHVPCTYLSIWWESYSLKIVLTLVLKSVDLLAEHVELMGLRETLGYPNHHLSSHKFPVCSPISRTYLFGKDIRLVLDAPYLSLYDRIFPKKMHLW